MLPPWDYGNYRWGANLPKDIPYEEVGNNNSDNNFERYNTNINNKSGGNKQKIDHMKKKQIIIMIIILKDIMPTLIINQVVINQKIDVTKKSQTIII